MIRRESDVRQALNVVSCLPLIPLSGVFPFLLQSRPRFPRDEVSAHPQSAALRSKASSHFEDDHFVAETAHRHHSPHHRHHLYLRRYW